MSPARLPPSDKCEHLVKLLSRAAVLDAGTPPRRWNPQFSRRRSRSIVFRPPSNLADRVECGPTRPADRAPGVLPFRPVSVLRRLFQRMRT